MNRSVDSKIGRRLLREQCETRGAHEWSAWRRHEPVKVIRSCFCGEIEVKACAMNPGPGETCPLCRAWHQRPDEVPNAEA